MKNEDLPQQPPASHRLRVIAAIHDLADFYRDHPLVPTPTSVTATSGTANLVELEALAAAHEVDIYGQNGRQMDVEILRVYTPAYANVEARVALRTPETETAE